jgi:protein involved in polysaccharide export with SLBB domain
MIAHCIVAPFRQLARSAAKRRASWAHCLIMVSAITIGGQSSAAQQVAGVTTDSIRTQQQYLRPGDIVRLRIWREPDLSGDFPVDENGQANFPLVGSYPVRAESRESLHRKLVAAYTKSVANLSMDVIFLRRVAVSGSVRSPGLYPLDPTMTVGDAVALAGGATIDAQQQKIQLVRSGEVLIANVDHAMLVSELPIQRGDQLYIPSGMGFFQRNPWVIGTIFQSLVAVVATIVTIANR